MRFIRSSAIALSFVALFALSCSKRKNHRHDDDAPINPAGTIRAIVYTVRGSNFNISYIDSNSVYQVDQVFKDSFVYQFRKGSGAGIGFTVHPQSPSSDVISSWSITIDGTLYANAFSEGGAFFTVPYK